MDLATLNKIDYIIELLEKDDTIIRLRKLKTAVKGNKQLCNKINHFKQQQILYEKNQLTSNEFIKIKKDLYEHPLFSQYHILEMELNYFLIYFNNRLNKLVENKTCKNPTCSRI